MNDSPPDPPQHYAFNPDWTVAPTEMLLEWAEERGTTPEDLHRQLTAETPDLADLLDDPPAALTTEKAQQLETLTGIPARLWNRFEAIYRADLVRLGRT